MPAEWRIVRIDDLFTIQQGKQVSEKNRNGDRQRPFLRTKNVYWGRLNLTELDAMHFSEDDEQRLRLLPGDLLTCEGGWVGRTAIWNGDVADCLYQNHLHRLRRISTDTDPQFALYWLWYAFETGEVYFGRQNVTTIPNLSKSRLGELPMPSPSRNEQRQIAGVLSAVQRAIERQERLIALTAELKKALMHKLFSEGTRGEPQKQTEFGLVPESWQIVEFERLAVLQRGVDLTRSEFREGTVPVAGSNGIIGYHDRANVKGPGVTVGRSGSVGKVMYYESGFWAHNTSLYVKSFRGNDPRYTAFHLETLNLGRFRSGASVPTLDRNSFKTLPVALPPLEEQKAIAGALAAVDTKANAETRRKLALDALFRALLHQLMTAQVRVHNLDLSALDRAEQKIVGAV